MNNFNGNGFLNTLTTIVVLVVMFTLLITAIRIFWPLLLVLGIYIAYRIYKTKKELEKTAFRAADNLQNDLFYEQVKRRNESGAIIDAEFTETEAVDKGESQ